MKQSFTLKAVALGLAAVATLGASAARPQVSNEARTSAKASLELSKTNEVNPFQVRTSSKVEAQAFSALSSHKTSFERLDITKPELPSRAPFELYGEWEDAGTIEYTFGNLVKNGFVEKSAEVKTYPYQKRTHRQNAQQFQIKVSNWGAFTAEEADGVTIPGCELILTVSPVQTNNGGVIGIVSTEKTGVELGWPVRFQDGNGGNVDVNMYYYDHYTWIKGFAELAKQAGETIKPEVVESWADASIYDYATGKFEIMPIYAGASTSIEDMGSMLEFGVSNPNTGSFSEFWYDYIQLSGKFYNYDATCEGGYFYRNAGETSGHYKVHYNINDNVVGVMKVIKGQIQDQNTLNTEFNAMLSAINSPTEDMSVFTTSEGWAEMTVNPYEDGVYSLLFGYSDGKEDANKNINFTGGMMAIYLSGAEYVLDGFANYNDVAIPAFFSCILKPGFTVADLGLPTNYKTNCQVEKSETEAGAYRLRAPYAEYPCGDVLEYEQSDDYLYYNVSDPANVKIDLSLTGLYIRLSETDICFAGIGSISSIFDTDKLGIQPIFGTYADNKVTVPTTTYTHTFQFTDNQGNPVPEDKTISGVIGCVFNSQLQLADFNGATNPSDFLIETGATDAIDNVEAAVDANAPVEFFNLQGQKVVNPAAGQLVIKKQGSKVTKVIAQ